METKHCLQSKKNLDMHLPKYVQDLYAKNYKMLI